jgi:integrase
MTGHVRRRGENSWELKFDIDPDPTTGARRIRYHSFKGSKKEANTKLVELLASVGRGTYVDSSKLTIEQHVRSRILVWTASGDISAKTAERYTELLENQIAPHIGAKLIQKLKTIDIETWHATLRTSGRKDGAAGISNRTIGHAHRVLSKALKEATRHDLVLKNVASIEGPPTVSDDEEVVILSPAQLTALPTVLKGHRLYARGMTLVYTGLRRGELLALRWNRINLDEKKLRVEETLESTKQHGLRPKAPKTKNSRRTITLPDVVVDILRDYRRQQQEFWLSLGLGRLPADTLVFPDIEDAFDSPRRVSKEWRDFADRNDMKGIPLHALRHTHASQLIDAGVDIVTVSKRLGHASPAITLKIYAHLFRKDDGKAAEAINAALSGVSGA